MFGRGTEHVPDTPLVLLIARNCWFRGAAGFGRVRNGMCTSTRTAGSSANRQGEITMLSTTTWLPEFPCVLGLCLVGALSGCAAEYAGEEEGAPAEVGEALQDGDWNDQDP